MRTSRCTFCAFSLLYCTFFIDNNKNAVWNAAVHHVTKDFHDLKYNKVRGSANIRDGKGSHTITCCSYTYSLGEHEPRLLLLLECVVLLMSRPISHVSHSRFVLPHSNVGMHYAHSICTHTYTRSIRLMTNPVSSVSYLFNNKAETATIIEKNVLTFVYQDIMFDTLWTSHPFWMPKRQCVLFLLWSASLPFNAMFHPDQTGARQNLDLIIFIIPYLLYHIVFQAKFLWVILRTRLVSPSSWCRNVNAFLFFL